MWVVLRDGYQQKKEEVGGSRGESGSVIMCSGDGNTLTKFGLRLYLGG